MIPITLTASNGSHVYLGNVTQGGQTERDLLRTIPSDETGSKTVFNMRIDSWPENSGAVVSLKAKNKKFVKGLAKNSQKLQASGPTSWPDDEETRSDLSFVISSHQDKWMFRWKGDGDLVSNSPANGGILMATVHSFDPDKGGPDGTVLFDVNYATLNPFLGKWKDEDNQLIKISNDGSLEANLKVEFLSNSDRNDPFFGNYEMRDVPVIYVNFSDDKPNAGTLSKNEKKINWTNGTVWERDN